MVSASPAPIGAPELPFDLQLVIEHLPIASLAPGGRKLRLHKKQDIAALDVTPVSHPAITRVLW